MGRPVRPIGDGLVYHALNRGNNRQAIFACAADYSLFLHALAQTRERYPFELFGYCLMTNHFHLLLRPGPGQSISRILQSLTVAHTWHYHRQQGTSGHVWQGRFKSPVIQEDDHLLIVLRYLESNPLRAGMVSDLKDYPWSSYAVHGLGQAHALVSEAPPWASLGATAAVRQAYWRRGGHEPQTERGVAAVRKAVTSGRPLGAGAWGKAHPGRPGVKLVPRP